LSLFAGIAVDFAGNLYIADGLNNRVRKVDTNGVISTIAGTGITDSTGDGGPAVNAAVSNPTGVALDAAGNVYIAEFGVNGRIRRITKDGIIRTFAGGGSRTAADGLRATDISFGSHRVRLDSGGNLYAVGLGSRRAIKVSPDGIVTVIAGNGNFGF